ncbi:MAG: activator of ATPase [Bacteroidetes bacterium]|nr:activator of ATPase [Bacteroidota bacterium]
MTRPRITIQTSVACDPDKIWEYWTQPEHIVHWNFASDDWHCPYAENNLKIGGKYLSRMEAKDKSFGFNFEAVYTDIDPGKKLVYVIEDGRTVVTTFEAGADNTFIKTVFEAENTFPEEMQHDGWLAILNNFKKYALSINQPR